jgi:NADP-dependent 3-hydroxy acid dehydrogenase YdfG
MAGGLLIIVGVGPGISLAVARRFGSHGFTVGLIARREQTLRKYRDELAAAGIRALYRVADCGRETELGAALQEIQAEAGVPEVLLYNAAHIKWKNLLDETAASLTADFSVNVAGALTSVRAVLPALRAANKGTILLTGSMFAEDPVPAFGSLSIGKAGLRNLAHGLAKSLGGTAIRVHYLSIQGRVTPEDPQRGPAVIAERCWQLHTEGVAATTIDVVIWACRSA